MTSFTSHSADLAGPTAFPWLADGLAYGGDYSPEQWPEEVWAEDVELMQRAGVNLVNLGVFGWGLLEVADGAFEWGWLDRIMDLLHAGGIGVNLATPTAAPPMWLLQAHPEIATVDADGRRTAQGGRLAWSPSSATFRRYALRMVRAMAERYGEHPALRMWHVSNELGNENARCYGDETAAAWRAWLAERYGDVDGMNDAWGSAFWGHRYASFAQVEPPRHNRTQHNPGLLLDFERFTSDALLGHYVAERDVLREVTPRIPVTTNFMVQANPGVADYARWAEEVDLVANDHYTIGADPHREADLAFCADRSRGMAGGRPWLLIEHSTAAVNWQPVNRAKVPGEMARNTLAHVARGADGAMFFQWRQSTAGSEQFHSAMVPHAGADSQVYRDVVSLGATLRALAPVVGSRVERARVALLFDHAAAAAWASGPKPTGLVTAVDLPRAIHRALTELGIAVDVLGLGDPLDGYRALVVPSLFLATDATADAVRDFAESGGHVLATYLSGIVDETNRARTGGYPGAFRDLLGVRVDEWFPLFAGEQVALDDGTTGTLWTERVEAAEGTEVLARLADGDLAGTPAVTRRAAGSGSATYLATRLDHEGLVALARELAELAGVTPVAAVDGPGTEVVRRVHDDGRSYLFAINHAASDRTVAATGRDLVDGTAVDGALVVPAGAVRVIEEDAR